MKDCDLFPYGMGGPSCDPKVRRKLGKGIGSVGEN